jgi:hypothetical protein
MNESCKQLIPLLEYDSTKKLKNPPEFKVKCSVCGQSNLYDNSHLRVSEARRVEGFAAAKGFQNA